MRRSPNAFPAPPPDFADGADAGLFAACGPVAGLRVLVIGATSTGLMCGLIRRGCTAAAEIAPGCRGSGAEPADLAILPQVGTLAQAAAGLTLAARLVLPGGRLVLRDTGGRLAGAIAGVLPQHGFSQVRRAADGTLILASRPFFGPHQAASLAPRRLHA